LLYSTCTFAPEEDEGVIAELLQGGGFEIEPLPLLPGFAPGKPGWLGADAPASLSGAVRLFPHRLRGEGHFACLLRRVGEAEESPALQARSPQRRPEKTDLRLWREFAQETLHLRLPEENLRLLGERLYYLPTEPPSFGRLRVTLPGVWLGFMKKDRFEPAHPLALLLRPGEAGKTVQLSADSPQTAAYLRGETLPTTLRGWALVCVDGWSLGWGKGAQGILKNHFPRGWM